MEWVYSFNPASTRRPGAEARTKHLKFISIFQFLSFTATSVQTLLVIITRISQQYVQLIGMKCVCHYYYAPPHSVGHKALTAVVCLSICHVPDPKSRMEGRSKPEIDRKEADDMGDPAVTNLKFERSKVKVSRPTNADTENAPYVPKGRPTNFRFGTWMEYENPHHRHGAAVTSKTSRAHNGTRRPASLTCAMTSELKPRGGCSTHQLQRRGHIVAAAQPVCLAKPGVAKNMTTVKVNSISFTRCRHSQLSSSWADAAIAVGCRMPL